MPTISEARARLSEAAARAPGFLRRAHAPHRVAAWREAGLLGAVIAATFLPFDFLYPRHLLATLALRLTLVASLLLAWWRLGRKPGRSAAGVVVASATAASLLTTFIVVVSDRSGGPRFGFALAVPFIVLSLIPDVPLVSVAAGAVAAIAGGVAMALDGWPPWQVLEWTTTAIAITGMTAFGAKRVRALDERAEHAEQERREAFVRLDESERRRAASERLALIGRLAAGVGHEINNPLSAVKGNVTCALEELERSDAAPAVREALAEALAAAERIAWITADMRALTTGAGTPLVPCQVREAICDALDRTTERLGPAKLILAIEPDLPAVRSDPRLLTDAISHLLAQAAGPRGLAPGGTAPTVRISARRVSGGIEITVEDDGPRIPAHVLPSIFEPFAAQGEVCGAGLGLTLPLTRELAERSGGRVGAAWHEHGNRYTLTLETAAG